MRAATARSSRERLIKVTHKTNPAPAQRRPGETIHMRKKRCTLAAALFYTVTALAQASPATVLTDAEKIYGLSHIWSEARYNFVYFDQLSVNWDSLYQATIPQVLAAGNAKDYYDVLRRFNTYLGDGHTSVWYPASWYTNEYAYAPLATALLQDKVFITAVLNDTLRSQGWQKGMEILQINGTDVHAWAQQLILPYQEASTPRAAKPWPIIFIC